MINVKCDLESRELNVSMQGEPITLMREMGYIVRNFVSDICTHCVDNNPKGFAEDLAKCFAHECLYGYQDSVKQGDNT